ncbi:MAG TPA: hypothetical protein P5123_07545, partial [Spirochaetota bacterium]|nr:hypothetical protein [Spirochaetota bacterium]
GKYVNSTKSYTIEPTYEGGPLDGKQKMEYEDTASGFGGILGVDVRVNNQLNIGLRIESEIALEYERDVKKDFSSTLEDGAKIDRDLPAVIGLGVEYKINEQFLIRPTFQGYMIGWANESKKDAYSEDYDDLGWEAGIGFEYAVMPGFLVASLGYLYSDLGGNEDTYNDGEYALDAHSIGTGCKLTPAPNVDITLGISGTFYTEGESDALGFDETFNKRVINIALGAEYRI